MLWGLCRIISMTQSLNKFKSKISQKKIFTNYQP